MKNMFKLLALVAIVAATVPARAQQFGTFATFWEVANFTNITATATNLAAKVTLTKYDSFNLDFVANFTNAQAGTIDIAWQTSNDDLNYGTSSGAGQHRGWFSIPLTNSGTTVCWNTNITVADVGYWRINWLTNASGQSMTNVTIKASRKPRTSG